MFLLLFLLRIAITAALVLSANAARAQTAEVASFTPQGEVRRIQQVAIRFSADMVRLGSGSEGDAPAPITVTCPQGANDPGKGRWLDTQRYVVEWPRDLPVGTRCVATLRANVKTLGGREVKAAGPWEFTTGGPKLAESRPYQGMSGIREHEIFLLRPDAQPDLASVDRHLQCQSEGEAALRMERLSREDGLRAMRVQQPHFEDRWWDEQGWLAYRCAKPFTNSAKVRLVWGAGIAASSGVSSKTDQILNYTVRLVFSLNVTCGMLEGNPGCDPRNGLNLQFSAPVTPAEFSKIIITADGAGGGRRIALRPVNQTTPQTYANSEPLDVLDEGGKVTVSLTDSVRDTDGRTLTNARDFPKTIGVAKLPPYVGFADNNSIVLARISENGTPARLVVAARYAERRLTAKGVRIGGAQGESAEKTALALLRSPREWPQQDSGVTYPVLAQQASRLPAPDNLPLETDGGAMAFYALPLDKPGLWLVEIDSAVFRAARREAQRPPAQRARLVQVTNLNVSLRASALGNSLIWITRFDDGKPVAGADIAVYDCNDALLWRGKSAADGTASAALNQSCSNPSHGNGHNVVVRHGDDLAVLPFSNYRNPRQAAGTVIGHTVLDRTLLKAGETLHLENHVREAIASGFAHVPSGRGTLEIRFNFNEVVHKSDLQWNEHGAAQATWRIPANAKLGHYTARVIHSASGAIYDAQFQIEEFRAPVFDAKLSGAPAWRTASQQELPLAASLNFLAGGAATGEKVSLQGRWTTGAPAPVAGFDFTNRRVAPFAAQTEAARPLTLDDKGEARTTLVPPAAQNAITLLAEMQFSDPNGEVQTVAQRFAVWPHPNKMGVRATVTPGAAHNTSRTVELVGVVLDSRNQPLAGKVVQFTAARARGNNRGYFDLAGEEEPACQSATNTEGQTRCEWKPGAFSGGNNELWLITARVEGESHIANATLNDWQLRWTPSSAVLEIEGLNAQDANAALAPDDTAQLRVRAPFVPATMLLTIEREGVLAHSVHAIETADTRVSLELKGHYAPNVQISAYFVRPVSALKSDAQASAGQLQTTAQHAIPLRVRPAAYALTVAVKPQREEARVRERVPVTVSVRTARGVAGGARVTLIAVDDALLALRPNATWNLFAAMTRQRTAPLSHHTLAALLAREIVTGAQRAYRPRDEGLRQADAVAEATAAGGAPGALMQRAFAAPAPAMKPAAAPPLAPEGGAADPAVRTDFSSLALWQTEIVTDANGNATVEVPLNDSLTRWRIVAIATHNADRFGTGDATLRTVQPLQLVSGLPLSVRSGDALSQKVTLRNTTQQSVTVEFTARAQLTMSDGVRDAPASATTDAARGLALSRHLTLKPQQNQEVAWPVSVPDGVDRLKWRISAKSGDLGDAIEIEQTVTPSVPVTVRQAMLLQIEKSTTVPVAQPDGARANAGGVSVDWKASLGDAALTEVRKWMRAYPFICLEQKTSKLAALGDRDGWDALMRELPKYLDGNGLARYFPTTQLPGSEILTAYVLDTAAALKWPIPNAEKTRMVNALRAQLAGRAQALDWAPQDVSVARALALQATVIEQEPARALERIVTPQDMAALPTTALVDWIRYLLASPKDATRGDALKEAAATLRSRYDVQGTRLNWRNEARENWWWFMWNGNVAAARTAWVVNRWSIEDPSWKDELPLLVTGLVGRQQQGHWGTTTANVWGSIALADFARAREAAPVSGTSTMRMGTQSATVTWPGAASTALGWSAAQDTLTLNHSGSGAPWATVAVRAAVKLDKPVAQGLTVARTVTPVEQKIAGQWSVGDVARVKLTMSSSAALSWVVVRDPVPSGANILGRGLARESTLAQQGQQRAGAWPVFEERAAESYRGYYRYIPQGPWSIEYTVRLNNAGTFEFPPARVEAMYAPEIFGETPIAPLVVQP